MNRISIALYYYSALIIDGLILPIWLLLLLLRWVGKKDQRYMIKERLAIKKPTIKKNKDKIIIWFHAPSLGETLAILPLLQKTAILLKKRNKKIHWVITCQSPSARLGLLPHIKNNFFNHHFTFCLTPIDNLWVIKKFWSQTQPTIFLLGESDFLPHRSLWLQKNKVTSILLNGRISNASFHFFNSIPHWRSIIFSSFTLLFAQSSSAQKRLQQLSHKKIHHYGNLKSAKEATNADKKLLLHYKKMIPKNKEPLLFSCCHAGEEEIILQLYHQMPDLKNKYFIFIVPRHPQEKIWHREFHNRMQQIGLNQKNYYLVKSFGQLASLYRLCPLVLLGGSWQRKGGHHPKESLEQGGFIIHGPHVNNNQDIYQLTDKIGISKNCFDISSIGRTILWFDNLSAKDKKLLQKKNILWQKQISNIMDAIQKKFFPTIIKIID